MFYVGLHISFTKKRNYNMPSKKDIKKSENMMFFTKTYGSETLGPTQYFGPGNGNAVHCNNVKVINL